MRIATYNVEWFARLFDEQDKLLIDEEWSGRWNVTRAQQVEALGKVFTALDADAVMIIEAPDTNRKQNTVRALRNFAQTFDLRQNQAVIGFANQTQQEIALLYDPSVLQADHDPMPGSPEAPRFDGKFRIDLDIDATRDVVQFSKPPLELKVTTAKGTTLRLIGAHLKSKAPHGETTRDGILRASIANRRKQLAQAIWLRARADQHIQAGESLMVLGDLNDGPGLDEFEHLFGRSSVEIVQGDDLYDPHARKASQLRPGGTPTSARFRIKGEGRFLQVLLDYIMVSQDLMSRRPDWKIWHPFEDDTCWSVPELRDALLTASDHFPVSLDIDI